MDMSWIVDEQKKIVNNVFDGESKYVQLPENGGQVSMMLRVSTPPKVADRDSKKTPGSKYTVYEYDTVDGKILTCYKTLHREIVTALAPFASKIDESNTEYVSVTIMNKGTLSKPNWFVIVGGGV